MATAVSTHHLRQDARQPRALQEAFADAFAVGNTGGFLKLHMNEIAREHNHPGVHFVVDRYFDAIANVDADRLASRGGEGGDGEEDAGSKGIGCGREANLQSMPVQLVRQRQVPYLLHRPWFLITHSHTQGSEAVCMC